jgi:exopolysaccharide biosynthesis predicted pyruvyltransferase EpsI
MSPSQIQQEISEALVPELKRFQNSRYAILDYPNYLNPGDAAIWIGTRAFLEQCLGGRPNYVSTLRGFNAKQCLDAIGNGPVFFLGGGNFGDLYQKHTRLKLIALDQLRKNPVILLPFSLANQSRSITKLPPNFYASIANHDDLLLATRERHSFEYFNSISAQTAFLCPDLSHFADFQTNRAESGEVSLFRKDSERKSNNPNRNSIDWPDVPHLKLTNRLGKLIALTPPGSARLCFYDYVARRKFRLATDVLAGHCRVSSDRLHGIILASEMSISVDAYDNSTGKVADYISTWKQYLKGISLKP